MKIFQDPTAVTWLGLTGLLITKAALLFVAYRLMPSDRKPVGIKVAQVEPGK